MLGMLAFLLLYVLSLGPAVRLVQYYPRAGWLFESVYCPLLWLADNTGLGKVLEVYVDLWLPARQAPFVYDVF
ncbi:MAG: hypothetical protein JXR37_06905 [Kiritimatiellae bacterium]|nr:hypothetical protein [Kiritimatiellia bacterium]